MNRITIIGNLTRDPEQRTTSGGVSMCTFTVAVNRKKKDETDFFRVTAWRELGDNCAKYLQKGRKVAVVGSVSLGLYTGQDGKTKGNLEVAAQEVEFLSPKGEQTEHADPSGMQQVSVFESDLPF